MTGQTLEGQLAQQHIEVEHLKTLVQRARDKTDEDKESLKKATRFILCSFFNFLRFETFVEFLLLVCANEFLID